MRPKRTPTPSPYWASFRTGYTDAGIDCGVALGYRTTIDGRPLPAPRGDRFYRMGYRAGLEAVGDRRWGAGPEAGWFSVVTGHKTPALG